MKDYIDQKQCDFKTGHLFLDFIREDDGLCRFVYKGKYYSVIPKKLVNEKNHITDRSGLSPSDIIKNGEFFIIEGKKDITPKIKELIENCQYPFTRCYIWVRKDRFSYKDIYMSQEFEEAVETVFMYRSGKYPVLRTDILGVDGNKLMKYGFYTSENNVYSVFYRDGCYHYVRTDSFCDVVEHTYFNNISEFWEYVEAAPYIRSIKESPNVKYIGYESKCADGKYIPEKLSFLEKMATSADRKITYVSETEQRTYPIAIAFEHPEKDRPVTLPYTYHDGALWICIAPENESAGRYEFDCFDCGKRLKLRTGSGRYGALGPFKCPFCNAKYNSGIDDTPEPRLHIYGNDGVSIDLTDTRDLLTDAETAKVKSDIAEIISALQNENNPYKRDDTAELEYYVRNFAKKTDKNALFILMKSVEKCKDHYQNEVINKLMCGFTDMCEGLCTGRTGQ